MYYRTSPRRLKKIRRPIPRHNSYRVPPYHRRNRVHGKRITPRHSAAPRRRQRLVRTHRLQVLLFLIILAILGWYSGLIPAGIAKLETFHPGQHSIQGSPTITATKIESILCAASSPACGSGEAIYNDGVAANINPAYALAFFQHESSFGLAGVARYSHSLGNLRCIPNYPCPGGYASFPSWGEGFRAWYALLNSNVYIGSGHTTIESIIPIYAPPTDNNDDAAYINSVISAVLAWEK